MKLATTLLMALTLLVAGCAGDEAQPATPEEVAFDLHKDLQPEAEDVPPELQPKDAFDPRNNPSNLGLAFHRRVDQLPLSGSSAKKPWPAYWWPYSHGGIGRRWLSGQYSPIEKYGLLTGAGRSAPYGWEYWRHGPGADPASWWGHCNGWSSMTLNEHEPMRPVQVRLSGGSLVPCSGGAGCVRFEVGDINALMTELYFHDAFRMLAGRCNRSNPGVDRYGRVIYPECRDANPGAFHIAVANMLGVYRRMVIVDQTYDWQVWNFPAYRYEVSELREVSASEANAAVGVASSTYAFNSAARRFWKATMRLYLVEDSIPPRTTPAGHLLSSYTTIETYQYILEASSDGTIIGGEWVGASKRDHPDFVWYSFRASRSGSDDDLNDADNPYVRYSIVKAILRLAQ